MRKCLLGLVFFFLVVGLSAHLYASETLGNFTWQLSQLKNAQGQDVTLSHDRKLFSLDIDFGRYYLNAYGTFSDLPGEYAQAVVGSGYLYENADHSGSIRMEVRAGTYLYNMRLDDQTLGGVVGIYDKDGYLIAVGSIDFLGLNIQSF